MQIFAMGFIILLASSVGAQNNADSINARYVVQEMEMTLSDVDSVTLGDIKLGQMVNHVDRQFSGIEDQISIRKRKIRLIAAWYKWMAAKREIELLSTVRDNLRAVYQLNLKLQESADIEDIAVLRSQNELLAKEITLLKKHEECRTQMLLILEVSNTEIISNETTSGGYNEREK